MGDEPYVPALGLQHCLGLTYEVILPKRRPQKRIRLTEPTLVYTGKFVL